MKKLNSKWMGFLMMALGLILGVVDCSAFVAATGIDGKEGVGKFSDEAQTTDDANEQAEEFLKKALDERVTKILPEDHIFDVIARVGGHTVGIDSLIYEYYSVDTLPNVATLTNAVSSQTGKSSTITVSDSDLFELEDTIYVPSVAAYDALGNAKTYEKLVLYVADKPGNNQLKVQAINGYPQAQGYRSVPNISANASLYRMARADREGNMRSATYSVLPTKEHNQCQIFSAEISWTTIMKMSRKEVNWQFSDVEEMQMNKMLREMEASFRWGAMGDLVPENNNLKGIVHTTQGIFNQIDRRVTYNASTPTNDMLIDMCKQIFVGNNGSKRRVLLAGADLIATLSKIASVQKQIDSKETKIVWGLEWSEIRTNFGTLYLSHDTTLDENGWAAKGAVIDPAYLWKAEFKKLNREALDTIKAGTFDGDVVRLQEISCMVLKNKSAHFIVEPQA